MSLFRKRFRKPHPAAFALKWHASATFSAAAIALMVVLFNPLNIEQGIGERGREIFFKIAAFGYATDRSPKTAVVLIDEDFLKEKQLAWPLSYSNYASLLREIADRRPKAIFLDLAFVDAHKDNTLTELTDELDEVARLKIPVYLAAGSAFDGVPEIRSELGLVVRTHQPWIRLVSARDGEPVGGSYAYRIADELGRTPAAVQMYQDLSHHKLDRTGRPTQMDVWWAAPTADNANCEAQGDTPVCLRRFRGVFGEAAVVLQSGLLPSGPDVEDPTLVPVNYAPNLTVSQLMSGDDFETVNKLLTGAVVFVGADLSLAGDRDTSPLQGPIAAVNTHAMAFDNLWAYGGRYVRLGPPAGWSEKFHTAFVVVILSGLVFLARAGITLAYPETRVRPHHRHALFAAVNSIVLIVGAIVVSVIEFTWLRLGPSTWAPVLVAAASGDLLSYRKFSTWVFLRLLGRTETAGHVRRRDEARAAGARKWLSAYRVRARRKPAVEVAPPAPDPAPAASPQEPEAVRKAP